MHMAYGTVKWLYATNGFGFVETAGAGHEVYLPGAELANIGRDAIDIGQAVSFEVTMNHDGRLSARNVKLR